MSLLNPRTLARTLWSRRDVQRKRSQLRRSTAKAVQRLVPLLEGREYQPDSHIESARLSALFIAHYIAKDWRYADEYGGRLVQLFSNNPHLLMFYSRTLRARGKRVEEVEAIARATSIRPNNLRWVASLARAQERLGRWEDAASSYGRALEGYPHELGWLYARAYAFERAGMDNEAGSAYARLQSVDTSAKMLDLGLGWYHQRSGRWEEASREYDRLLAERTPEKSSTNLLHRAATAHDRCLRFKEARALYELACERPDADPVWSGRLGFIYERLSLWGEAQAHYTARWEAAKALGEDTQFWLYRRVYCYAQTGSWDDAVDALLRDDAWNQNAEDTSELTVREPVHYPLNLEAAMAGDWSDVERLADVARFYEEHAEWALAEESLRELAARRDMHAPAVYARLASTLIKLERYEEACEAFLETRRISRHEGVSTARYWNDVNFRRRADFIEFSENRPVIKKLIVYECFHAINMTCNPWALYKYAINSGAYNGFTHVWVINDHERIPIEARKRRDTIFIKRHSDLYIRYLGQAEYVINNTTFPEYYSRRPEQKYLNTWHGTPIKALGRQMRGRVLEWRNVTRNFLHSTHIISPNAHTTDAILSDYDIRDAFSGRIAETGYPRIDSTVNADSQRLKSLRKSLGLRDGDKVILYAPTFRSTTDAATHDVEQLHSELEALAKLGAKVLFRGHHLAESSLKESKFAHHVVSPDVHTNELLALVDVLITDYSSLAIDFLPLNRPIVFYVFDSEVYEAERGLYLNAQSLPGYIATNKTELLSSATDALRKGVRDQDEHTRAVELYAPLEDGNASGRVLDWFIRGLLCEQIRDVDAGSRDVILLYGGAFIPNGITSSFKNLSTHLDGARYAIKLAVDPRSLWENPERQEQFAAIPATFGLWGSHLGPESYGSEELWAVQRFRTHASSVGDAFEEIYQRVYGREARRLFGDIKVDYVVDFEGFNVYWTSVMSALKSPTLQRKAIYQHSDVFSEWKSRFPWFDIIGRSYKNFDVLISVSKTIRDLNMKNLRDLFDLSDVPHVFCPNEIHSERMRELANEKPFTLDEDKFYHDHDTVFVSMGRLSHAKDYSKLIAAFSQLGSLAPERRPGLLIIGDGPLKDRLRDQIRELDVGHDVVLLGQKSNPFPYLRRADCFVLSSIYEGQPMVLLESLSLGVPIITTKFDSVYDVITPDLGTIVENSVDGLVEGMREFVEHGLPRPQFDSAQYERDAIERFYEIVIDGKY